MLKRQAKSRVFFVRTGGSEDVAAVSGRLETLLEKSAVLGTAANGDRTAVKIHFGEEGNFGFIRPEYARVICDRLKARGALPFLTDTNTLYRGQRTNSKDHLATACRHGFTKESTGAEIIVPDDSRPENAAEVAVAGGFIKSAKIARLFTDADSIIAASHLKGHILTGFGGALKNIAMGCATRAGKLAQHCDVSPVVYKDKCIGCGTCRNVCPAGAILIESGKSVIDKSKCVGCAACVEACPTMAMFIDMRSGDTVQMRMVEYAAAVVLKKKRIGYINFAVKITKECDCWGGGSPRIAPDVGIFASLDPVAIDKAGFDLVNNTCGRDIFKEAHPDQDGLRQLEHAEKMGLGSMSYELVEL